MPGVLDHRDFEITIKDLGKCDLCGGGKAVFSSGELKMSFCERCFGRILRKDLKESYEIYKKLIVYMVKYVTGINTG